VFAKQPQPGLVKTRLASAASPAWAAHVAEAFLCDTLDRLAVLDARRVLAYSPPQAVSYFVEVAAKRYLAIPQTAGELGQRMAALIADQFQAGAVAVVLIGTDSPTLPIAYIEQAFRELEQADVVLGPATDGGYYLVGCARALPPIFAGVAWGTCRVLHETMAALPESARLALLPPWYDVDTLEDWRMLQGHVAALRRAGLDPGVPRTERLLTYPAS
jgi:rSAM/selenodomain-associated transferase 1